MFRENDVIKTNRLGIFGSRSLVDSNLRIKKSRSKKDGTRASSCFHTCGAHHGAADVCALLSSHGSCHWPRAAAACHCAQPTVPPPRVTVPVHPPSPLTGCACLGLF
jgi:hypothetical protein